MIKLYQLRDVQEGEAGLVLPCEEKIEWIPWVPCMWPTAPTVKEDPDSETYYAKTVRGLRKWEQGGGMIRLQTIRGAVVETRVGNADLWRRLEADVPNVAITPALSLVSCLEEIDDVGGWNQAANEIEEWRREFDVVAVMLSAESVLTRVVDGAYSPDPTFLADGLLSLPDDLIYWFVPSDMWFRAGVEGALRLHEVAKIVERTLSGRVRHVNLRHCSPKNINSDRYEEGHRRLEDLASLSTIPKFFFYGPENDHFWQDDELPEVRQVALETWGGPLQVLLYPGLARWPEAAASLSRFMSAPCE